MTPERLSEIKTRITRNHSAPDVPELAFELIRELEKRLEADRAKSVGEPADPAAGDPPGMQPESDGPPEKESEESGGFFSRKKSKK